MSQTKNEEKTSLVLLPAVAAINIGAKALSIVTGTTPEEVKNTAGSFLRGDERSLLGLRGQLETANKLILNLEQDLARRNGESIALAADLMVDDVRHALKPSLDAEYNVERELFSLLRERITDTELAEQYKTNAQREAVYFQGIIESLQGDMKKELAVIESQKTDKANLERVMAHARNTIDKLKLEVEHSEEKRQADLNEQKLKYKSQQARIVSEFEAATEFCRDLRKQLQVEIENNKTLVESSDSTQQELEALQKDNEANIVRLQKLSSELQEQRHKVARLNQERQKESENAREQITTLKEQVQKVVDNITIIEKKGAEEQAKQLKKVNEEMDEIIRKYKEQIKTLEEERESESKKHEEDVKIQTQLIGELEQKDVDDVDKERKKAEGEIKKIKNAHFHFIQRLNAKLEKLQAEAATSARLATILRDQYETEKHTSSGLQGRLSGLRGELQLSEGQRKTLQERLAQFERDLQQERDVSDKQLEIARKSIMTMYESQRKVISTTYENEVKKISEELKIQTKLAQEAGKRLNDTRRDLESRQFNLQNDTKELKQRLQAAEDSTRSAIERTEAALKRLHAAQTEEQQWEKMVDEEKQRADFARRELTLQTEKTKLAEATQAERIKELETETSASKTLIEEFRERIRVEEEKGKNIAQQKEATHNLQLKQISELEAEIASVRAQAKKDREEAEKLQQAINKAKNDNKGLKKEISEASSEVREKDHSEKKEIHNVSVKVVERN